MQHIDIELDITIRNVAANFLVDLCLECDTKRCLELLDILEKVLKSFVKRRIFLITVHLFQIISKPFTLDTSISVDADIKDVKTAIVGVIKIFTSKIYRLPSSHAICAYKVLVNHLEQHYKDPSVFYDVSTTRYLVIFLV